jgi:3-oxoacid CoA-transferase subunit A
MNQVYLMADIHGDWRPVRDFLNRIDNKYDNTDTIIILGDAGLNFFFNHRDENTKTKLNKLGINLFIIRGNHEERPEICAIKYPEQWHIEEYFGNKVWVENDYPYIKYAWDKPAMYNINGYTTMVLPGAYSVDKYRRLQMGWSWFETEQLEEWEMSIGRETLENYGYKCDLVLSHTCPIIYEPTDLFLSVVDQSMVDKAMERYLGEIEYNLDYKAWCWGHYHTHREYPSPDGRRRLMLMHDVVRLENVIETEVTKYVEVL